MATEEDAGRINKLAKEHEARVAHELACEIAEAMQPALETGHAGAFDCRRVESLITNFWVRHSVGTVEQAERIYALMMPKLAERQAAFVGGGVVQPRSLN
jgi:hypothetical protein